MYWKTNSITGSADQTSFYFSGDIYFEVVTLGVKRLKKSEVNLNCALCNVNPWAVPRTGNKRPPHIKVHWLFRLKELEIVSH